MKLTPEQVAEAERIIGTIDGRLERWRAWFPDDRSEVEIPRCDLLLLVELARDRLHGDRPAKEGGCVMTDLEFPTLDALCRRHVRLALEVAGGSKRDAAKLLGVSRKTVYNWVRRLEAEDRKAAQAATSTEGA